jgi:hypothetical protein
MRGLQISPESKYTLGRVLLLLALLSLAWSPLPEILLGKWLLVSNHSRERHGAGHLRHGKALAGQMVADSLGRQARDRQHEQSLLVTLPRLRRHLLRYGELGMSWPVFLELYAEMPSHLASVFMPDSILFAFDELNQQPSVYFERTVLAPLRARVTFEHAGERLLGRELQLDKWRFEHFGLSFYSYLEDGRFFDDPTFEPLAMQRVIQESLLPDHVTARLLHLKLSPGTETLQAWRAEDTWLLECIDEGRHLLLEIHDTDLFSDSFFYGEGQRFDSTEALGNGLDSHTTRDDSLKADEDERKVNGKKPKNKRWQKWFGH